MSVAIRIESVLLSATCQKKTFTDPDLDFSGSYSQFALNIFSRIVTVDAICHYTSTRSVRSLQIYSAQADPQPQVQLETHQSVINK